jgi:hypothetical protein
VTGDVKRCPCGAEAVVVDDTTALCARHALALDPAELYRLERARRAPARDAHRLRLRAAVVAADLAETNTLGVMGLRRGGRRSVIAVGRRLYGPR